MSSVLWYPLIGGQDFMPTEKEVGGTDTNSLENHLMCSYEGCSEDPITLLGDDTPSCKKHLQDLTEELTGSDEDKGKGERPVASNNDNAAVWIGDEKDRNGNAYFSVKVDGVSENVFPDSDLLQKCLNEMFEMKN